MTTTVRDIRDEFLSLFPHFHDVGDGTEKEFFVWRKLASFWEELNHLGARNMDVIPPETVPDVDSTVELTDEECVDLRAKMAEFKGFYPQFNA